MRRDFQLSEDDRDCLEAGGHAWEAVIEGQVKWIIIRGYPIPSGYTVDKADAAVRIPPGYPDDQIDMVYFHPPLAIKSGKPIARLTPHPLEGKSYQQWSRHRTGLNPWRLGLDNVCSHYLQVSDWLQRELSK